MSRGGVEVRRRERSAIEASVRRLEQELRTHEAVGRKQKEVAENTIRNSVILLVGNVVVALITSGSLWLVRDPEPPIDCISSISSAVKLKQETGYSVVLPEGDPIQVACKVNENVRSFQVSP